MWTVATGDCNGEGQTDLVWTHTTTGDRYLWLMKGIDVSSTVFIENAATELSIAR